MRLQAKSRGKRAARCGFLPHRTWSPWYFALVMAWHARIYSGESGPCLSKSAYMFHVIQTRPRGMTGISGHNARADLRLRLWNVAFDVILPYLTGAPQPSRE